MTSTWVRSRSTSDEEAPFGGGQPDEPEYHFDGFIVEFSHTVRLTPVELAPAAEA